MNSIPLEIVYDMDRELGIPETRGNKVTKFRPLNKELHLKESSVDSSIDHQNEPAEKLGGINVEVLSDNEGSDSVDLQSNHRENNGNVPSEKPVEPML